MPVTAIWATEIWTQGFNTDGRGANTQLAINKRHHQHITSNTKATMTLFLLAFPNHNLMKKARRLRSKTEDSDSSGGVHSNARSRRTMIWLSHAKLNV